MDGLLDIRFNQATKGREIWLNLLKDYNIKANDYILLLPSDNKDYNHYSLYYLEKFLKKKNSTRAIVLTASAKWFESAITYTDLISDVIKLTIDEVKDLLTFYCFYEFTDKLIIGSLEEPEGRMGKNIIGKHGLTVSDVIKVTLYDLLD